MNIQLNSEGRGQQLYRRAKNLIPGGTQLLSKRPEMFLPEYWPSYYSKASGAEVWDLDNNKYIDMSYSGIGSTVLGFADPDVNIAVKTAIDSGSMCTLNCVEEVELAELLLEIHQWAEMVRFGRCGGEAMAMAIRIARAFTGRDEVAFCGYHGWHDWYLAANLREAGALNDQLLPGLEPAGVVRGLQDTAFPFHYNKIEELKSIVNNRTKKIAAIVMEPVREHNPLPGFLESVRQIASDIGAVLIFDEVTSGLRITSGGAHLNLGVAPDIAVLAKALGNGYPMAAIIGKQNIMQAAQKSFISSTYWTEKIGPVAALATLKKHRSSNAPAHLCKIGKMVKSEWQAASDKAKLPIHIGGLDPLGHFGFDGPNKMVMKTLFTQLMLERGFLATTSFYSMLSHTIEQVSAYGVAVHEAFGIISKANDSGNLDTLLKGKVCHSGFARLT